MAVYWLTLSLLIFSATQGSSAEEGTQNTTSEGQMNCSSILQLPHQEEISDLVQELNSTDSWPEFRAGIKPLLDNNSVIYQQVQNIRPYQNYPLYTIAERGFTELVTLLLCKGFYVDKYENWASTMLMGATVGGHVDLVKLLLGQGADPNVKLFGVWTPLIRAAHVGNLDMVKALVEAGVDTAFRNSYNFTARDLAEHAGKWEVVRYLEQLPH